MTINISEKAKREIANPTPLKSDTDPGPITESRWFNDLLDGIMGTRQGGARIIVDAEGAATGVGKTSAAVAIARLLAKIFDYELEEDDFTLSGSKYLDRWREHPGADQPSVLVLDELGGAGAGNARRAMSNQNVELGSAWQLMRKKRIVTLATLPHWSRADRNMRQQADYRLWCQKKPIGKFRPYAVGADFDDGSVRTRGYDEAVGFPDLKRHGDPFYYYLSEKKDELLESQYMDADKLEGEEDDDQKDPDEVRREEKIRIAQRLRDGGMTTYEVAEQVDMSQGWVATNTEAAEKPNAAD